MVLDPCVSSMFYNVRLTHVLCTVNVRCTFCGVAVHLIAKARLAVPSCYAIEHIQLLKSKCNHMNYYQGSSGDVRVKCLGSMAQAQF